MVRKVILEDNSGEELIPYTNLATSQSAGRVRPDGSTTSVDANGVISTINMQTTITGAATTVVSDNLTKSRAVVTNASGKLAASGITATELSYLDNATSNIQTQLDGKVSTSATGVAELGYLNGVTSAIQTQINNCVHLSGNETIAGNKTFTGDHIIPTVAVSDNSQKGVNTTYINTKFQVMNEADLPANRDANTFYFVKE